MGSTLTRRGGKHADETRWEAGLRRKRLHKSLGRVWPPYASCPAQQGKCDGPALRHCASETVRQTFASLRDAIGFDCERWRRGGELRLITCKEAPARFKCLLALPCVRPASSSFNLLAGVCLLLLRVPASLLTGTGIPGCKCGTTSVSDSWKREWITNRRAPPTSSRAVAEHEFTA
eukprot:4477743-Pleurochrysis_carterae.AAC.1